MTAANLFIWSWITLVVTGGISLWEVCEGRYPPKSHMTMFLVSIFGLFAATVLP